MRGALRGPARIHAEADHCTEMGFRKDIWRPAIIEASVEQILARNSLADFPFHWLPPMPLFCFLADPFGLWRDGRLHVFVEFYDYRVRIGRIDVLIYDRELNLVSHRPALSEDWHLSYPQVFEHEGETWMLPEAHKSGTLALYRCLRFPDRWEKACAIDLGKVPIDATPVRHLDRWWLFYTVADREADKIAALHVASAEQLQGPWLPCSSNPIRYDKASARPGGKAVVMEGKVMLPVQDCSRTYGGAIRPLWLDRLSAEAVTCRAGAPLATGAAFAPFLDGCHTLSAAGRVTLIDVKRIDLSLHGAAVGCGRWLRDGRRRVKHRLAARPV